MIIINKEGALHNAADRDHCLKYMVAVVLLKGAQVDTEDYQDRSQWASDPRIEELRSKITMVEDEQFTRDYHNQEMRSLSNALLVTLKNGTTLPEVVVEYPLEHVRRSETLDALKLKTDRNLKLRLSAERVEKILSLADSEAFLDTSVTDFVDLFVPEN